MSSDYTGMWWEPAKLGSGVFIEHLVDENCLCGAWYFYDETGSPIWATFWGRIGENSLVSDLYVFTGPGLGQEWDTSKIVSERAGNVTFSFVSDSSVTMTYNFRGVSGRYDLVMFSMPFCPGWLWWDPEMPGQGVVLFPLGEDVSSAEHAFVWYVYDTNGSPIWFTAVAPKTDTSFHAYRFTGPPLGQEWDVNMVEKQTAGTFTADAANSMAFSMDEPLMMPSLTFGFDVLGFQGQLHREPFMCSSLCRQ